MTAAAQVTIAIPSLNPDEKLLHTVQDLIRLGFTDIILINDGSEAECVRFFPSDLPECTLLTHPVNRGKGAAMKTAFQYFLDSGRTTAGIITVDGDGQHKASDVLKCAEELIRSSSVVLGVRDFNQPNVPRRSRLGNKITSLIVALSVKSITRRSTPMPSPPVGGMPYSRAFMKSSSTCAERLPALRFSSTCFCMRFN